MSEFRLLHAVEKLVDRCNSVAAHKRISIQSYADPDLPAYFTAEAFRFVEPLESLVRHAIELTSYGQIFVAAEFAHISEQAGVETPVRLQVDTTSFDAPDPGMHKLIAQLGSELHVKTQSGIGSQWFFDVNLRTANKRIERPVFSGKGSELRIFVVSNEPPPNRVIQNYLRYAGVRCDGAPTAREALLELSRVASFESPYQLIMVAPPLLDADLFELAKVLRESSIHSKTRLVFVDERFNANVREKALSGYFDAYLSKPFQQQQLFDATTELLGATDSLNITKPESAPIILVVDDNAVNQKMILFQLRRLGYDADAVDNGREAVRALRLKPNYFLVLMDLAMPVLNGWDASAEIRSGNDLPRDIPIVALTTDDSQSALERCRLSGINDVVYKPITLDALKTIVQQYPAEEQRYKAS